MFGLFKKKLDPSRDLSVQLFEGAVRVEQSVEGGRYRLLTAGLTPFKRRELEMVDVPFSLVDSASRLMTMVGTSSANEKAVAHQSTFARPLGPVLMAVRGFDVSSFGAEVVRLGDLDAKELPTLAPVKAITAMQLAQGFAAGENAEEALRLWRASIEAFAGAANRGPPRFFEDKVLNEENHFTYLALAQHDSENAERWYRLALERSSIALAYELGADELPALAAADVMAEAARLIVALQEGEGGEPWGPERMKTDGLHGAEAMAMMISPLISRGGDGVYRRQVNPGPFAFRNYFYEAPVRDQLRAQPVLALVAELYEALRKDPPQLLARTLDTRNVFNAPLEVGEPYGTLETPLMSLPVRDSVPPYGAVLTRLVADIGRRLSAGLTIDELRAAYELTNDPALKAQAEVKWEALKVAEGNSFAAAVGANLEA